MERTGTRNRSRQPVQSLPGTQFRTLVVTPRLTVAAELKHLENVLELQPLSESLRGSPSRPN